MQVKTTQSNRNSSNKGTLHYRLNSCTHCTGLNLQLTYMRQLQRLGVPVLHLTTIVSRVTD